MLRRDLRSNVVMLGVMSKSSAGKVRGVAELLCAVGVGTVWVGE